MVPKDCDCEALRPRRPRQLPISYRAPTSAAWGGPWRLLIAGELSDGRVWLVCASEWQQNTKQIRLMEATRIETAAAAWRFAGGGSGSSARRYSAVPAGDGAVNAFELPGFSPPKPSAGESAVAPLWEAGGLRVRYWAQRASCSAGGLYPTGSASCLASVCLSVCLLPQNGCCGPLMLVKVMMALLSCQFNFN